MESEDGGLTREAEALGKLQTRDRDLTEALEQQTATAQVLELIASSPGDLQPTFDGIVQRARQLCDGLFSVLYGVHGELVTIEAHDHITPENRQLQRSRFPMAVNRTANMRSVFLEGRVVQVEDAAADPHYQEIPFRQAVGYRTLLLVPMLREGTVIGAIGVGRVEPGGFADKQVRLLQTFASQAVIAIENVRLFNETKEALEQQTATSDILRVISSSPTDVQPVFGAIADSAMRLCETDDVHLNLVEGDRCRRVMHRGPIATLATGSLWPIRGFIAGRAVTERRTIHIADVMELDESEYPNTLQVARRWGTRTALAVPLLREGSAIGVIVLRRGEVRPFSDRQLALLHAFADQAVIAIENVRLFTELQARNRDLTEALGRQTATSEILQVISRSPTDVQPVFDTIVESAATLCDAAYSVLGSFDGELLDVVAAHNWTPAAWEAARRTWPTPPRRAMGSGRAILERAVVHIPDVELDPEYAATEMIRAVGFRSLLAVPMMREGRPVGVILVGRAEPGPFSDAQIALLQTFADQAVIAIENVRLFTELRDRTAQLGRSVDELTALGQVSQALSSTLELETVLTTIVQRAIELSGADGGSVYEYDDSAEEFRLRATRNFEEELVEAARTMRRGEGALGRLAEQRGAIQIPDISDPAVYQSSVRESLLRTGYRAVLALPLLRDDRLVGALVIGRKAVGQFAAGVVDLLTTFANQATLAMQNARLFREIAEKGRQLEVASQHKSEFLANMSHELRTPLNAIIGFSEVLSEKMFGELNEKQEEYSKDIHASGQHLLSLINDILDLSKIEAGRMELELTDFHLPTALDSALTLVRERAGRRAITLQINVDSRLGQIQADERKVRQVVLNLLSNAIKFTPEGGRIDVSAVPKDGLVEVSVSDTGVGIAPEDQEAVFEEFRQVGTADKKVEGTGLGLTLCRKFVELHGGRIWVKSEVGVGSTFSFTLPLRSSQ